MKRFCYIGLMLLSENPLCNPHCRVCHYKNLDYPQQISRKQEWAEIQLGRWRSVLKAIRPAPPKEQIGYRSKSWLRAEFVGQEVEFGMHRSVRRQGRWETEFISWDTCPLHVSGIQEIIGRVKDKLSGKISEDLRQNWVGLWIGSPHIVLVSRASQLDPLQRLDWERILVPPFDRVWFHLNPQVGRRIFSHHPIEPVVGTSCERVHPIRAFRQSAQTLLQEARREALNTIVSTQPQMLLDLYCGTGEMAPLLPDKMGWVGIELSQEAVKFAQIIRGSSSGRGNDPEARVHEAFVGSVEHRLRDPKVLKLISSPYSLYVNPPRSGMSEDALRSVFALIQEKRPTSILYLSCSASRLARDLQEFEKWNFEVKSLQPYDFFPQTEHFEILAVLISGGSLPRS